MMERLVIVKGKIHHLLIKAYQQAKYVIYDSDNEFYVKVGIHYPYLDDLLARHNAACAALITAFNPRSQRLEVAENLQRNKDLRHNIGLENYTFLEAYSTDEKEEWPKEESFFIFNIERSKADYLAKKFIQNAYLWVEIGQPVTLLMPD